MKGILPELIRTRKDKVGFNAPADKWFRGINKEQVSALLHSETLSKRGLFNLQELDTVFDEHIKGIKNHQMLLWQMINLELWFRRFFD
jgi:asparagine synthase (glutamine-hydrolysing)